VGRTGIGRDHTGVPGAVPWVGDTQHFAVSQMERAEIVVGAAAPHQGDDPVWYLGISDVVAAYHRSAGVGVCAGASGIDSESERRDLFLRERVYDVGIRAGGSGPALEKHQPNHRDFGAVHVCMDDQRSGGCGD